MLAELVTLAHLAAVGGTNGATLLIDGHNAQRTALTGIVSCADVVVASRLSEFFVALRHAKVGVIIRRETRRSSGTTVVVWGLCTSGTSLLIQRIAVVSKRTCPKFGVDAGDVGTYAVFGGSVALFGLTRIGP